MSSRMDKYDDEKQNIGTSRTEKNKNIYDKLYTSTSYTEFADLDNNAIEISSSNDLVNKREDYQKSRKISSVIDNEINEKKILENVSYELIEPSLKNYDINSVLEEAKKNRNDNDALERKRKLKTIEEYDILSNLTQDKIKDYKDKKREVITEEEEEELIDLIEAVTGCIPSQTEDSSNLFDDLMPSSLDETIVTENLTDELNGIANLEVTFEHTMLKNIEPQKQPNLDEKLDAIYDDEETKPDLENTNTETNDYELDDSFFSKSMDLSDTDLMDTQESQTLESGKRKNKKSATKLLIIMLILVLLAIFGVIIYALINKII